jgi:hypothetical protein
MTAQQGLVNRQVVSQAVVTATGVTADGRREVLGFDVGDSDNGHAEPRSCVRCTRAAWPGCTWSPATRTPA